MALKISFCNVIIAPIPYFTRNCDEIISALPFGESEKQRLSSINNKKYKESSVSALICLEELLKTCGASPNEDLSILRTDNRKPYFSKLPLYFSISHSEDTVAVALSDAPVGIDLEFISEDRDIIALAQRFFDSNEQGLMLSSKDAYKDFFAIWTKKEAISKINGEGLSGLCRADTDCSPYFLKTFLLSFEGTSACLSIGGTTSEQLPDLKDFIFEKRCDIYEI